jgi:hypothetical protein
MLFQQRPDCSARQIIFYNVHLTIRYAWASANVQAQPLGFRHTQLCVYRLTNRSISIAVLPLSAGKAHAPPKQPAARASPAGSGVFDGACFIISPPSRR